MGTSGSSSGSGSNTPLVPSWLGNGTVVPLPGGDEGDTPKGNGQTPNGDAGDTQENNGQNPGGDTEYAPEKNGQSPGSDSGGAPEKNDQNQPDSGSEPKPYLPSPAPPKRFQDARTNFSRFARSGGNDTRALNRAIHKYVRSGTQGIGTAVQRMRSSRIVASNALGVLRSIQRHGVNETLQRFNLEAYSGLGVQEMFLGLTEFICADGGLIDDSIARDAWLETIAELDQFGIEDLDTLSPDQIHEFFLSFIAHSIETRLYQEIGVNGFKFADSLDDIDGFDSQLRDYIARDVSDSFQEDLSDLSNMTDDQIRDIVDNTYRNAWDLLQTWKEDKE